MTTAAVVVLVAGLLVVALIVGGALLLQRRRERAPVRPPRSTGAPTWPREGPPTDPITTRTAQEDPPTVRHPAPTPLFGEGERHPTPPHGGNGRAR